MNRFALFASGLLLASTCLPASAVTIALTGATAPAGAPVSVAAQSSDAEQLTAFVLRVSYPADKLTFLNAKAGSATQGKSVEANAAGGTVSIAIFGGATTFSDGVLATLSFEVAANAAAGEQAALSEASGSGADVQAAPVDVTASGAQITVSPPAAQHTADTSKNWRISLAELLRVIQFYNSNGYHCATGTDDGYAPGVGELSCGYHNSDFSPADGKIYLAEVLRLIQFFNIGGYHTDAAQSDTFAPGFFQ